MEVTWCQIFLVDLKVLNVERREGEGCIFGSSGGGVLLTHEEGK